MDELAVTIDPLVGGSQQVSIPIDEVLPYFLILGTVLHSSENNRFTGLPCPNVSEAGYYAWRRRPP